MTALYKPTDRSGQPLNVVYAEDVSQLVDAFTGQRSVGALTPLGQIAVPAGAPTITLQSGSLTGAYKWEVYWIDGVMDGTNTPHINGRTTPGAATTTQNPASQQATVSIAALTPPTGVIGWGVARTLASGTTFLLVPGSEQFLSIAGTMPATFIDNTPDGSLVTPVQATNTTGTTIGCPVVTAASTLPQAPANGARAQIRGGSTPYDFVALVYDSTYGHWVGPVMEGMDVGVSGSGGGTPSVWQGAGDPTTISYGSFAAAGLTLQARWIVSLHVTSGSVEIGVIITAGSTTSDVNMASTSSGTNVYLDTGWQSLTPSSSSYAQLFMRFNPSANNATLFNGGRIMYRWIA